jgi:hypothetical protein
LFCLLCRGVTRHGLGALLMVEEKDVVTTNLELVIHSTACTNVY